jgi:hypothetical protein
MNCCLIDFGNATIKHAVNKFPAVSFFIIYSREGEYMMQSNYITKFGVDQSSKRMKKGLDRSRE